MNGMVMTSPAEMPEADDSTLKSPKPLIPMNYPYRNINVYTYIKRHIYIII